MYDLEEWINKPHTSVEEILEELTEDTFFNLMISEAIREDALDNTLSRFQQRLQQFNVNSVNNTANTSSPDDFQFGGDESAIDTSLQNTQLNMQNNPQGNMQQPQQNMQASTDQGGFDFGADPSVSGGNMGAGTDTPDFGLGDADPNTDPTLGGDATGGDFDFGGDMDLSGGMGGDPADPNNPQDPSGFNPEQNIEDQKDKLMANIKQLMELRDLLDEVISTTTDPQLLKINQQINKLLSTIANIGDSIMDRADITEINTELEQFLTDAVEQAKQKIEQIKNENKNKK